MNWLMAMMFGAAVLLGGGAGWIDSIQWCVSELQGGRPFEEACGWESWFPPGPGEG